MTTEPEAVPADVGPVKPLDLSTLLRHAFLAGRGLTGEFDKLSEADQAAWVDYDPTELKPFKRITAALYLADRASRVPVDGAGWRPMETAPKDGTRFLAFEAERENQRYECWWQDDFANWTGWQDDWDDEPEPTHWMPLPAAPGTHPAPASPDAEMVKRLGALAYHIQQTGMADKQDAELVLRAAEALSKHGGPRS